MIPQALENCMFHKIVMYSPVRFLLEEISNIYIMIGSNSFHLFLTSDNVLSSVCTVRRHCYQNFSFHLLSHLNISLTTQNQLF